MVVKESGAHPSAPPPPWITEQNCGWVYMKFRKALVRAIISCILGVIRIEVRIISGLIQSKFENFRGHFCTDAVSVDIFAGDVLLCR